ncbi:hypothetical protein KAR04_00960 [Candidatus Calescamantes bacterium]|nr:hypothetical protein [Candidatus Calescamantes bacterium]
MPSGREILERYGLTFTSERDPEAAAVVYIGTIILARHRFAASRAIADKTASKMIANSRATAEQDIVESCLRTVRSLHAACQEILDSLEEATDAQ